MCILFLSCLLNTTLLFAAKNKDFDVKSPDGNIIVHVEITGRMQWSVIHKGQQVIAPSAISLQLEDEEILGDSVKLISSQIRTVNTVINAIIYKKTIIKDNYTELSLKCKRGYSVVFRVYNDAVAYRFTTTRKGDLLVKNEEANFNFTDDEKAFIPIQWDYRNGKNFNSSFEALYHELKLSQFPKDSLAFLPILVDIGQNKKVAIVEADLEEYPGMYLDLNESKKGFKGVFAPYPLHAQAVGSDSIPDNRADYICKTSGTRGFPWRAIIISEQDKDLLNQDIVQKLASPSRIADLSWIKPGQVSWDWWNARNISHVNFEAGLNTPTYKYYIDFAAANHLGYIIIDGGWSSRRDLLKVAPSLNLPDVVEYGEEKGIRVILWALWDQIDQQMEKVFPYYSKMGIAGFKIDYIDRDDQLAVASTYAIAKLAAKYKLLIDYHGAFKPTGLQRTYPNVIGYEGVKGLENFKWANEDQPRYTSTIPFIRMLAGPMDYTPGAMRNSNNANYRAINNNPMSKGTRCQQLAEYVVFEAPLQMLSDNPTIYMREQECTNFITKIPTTFDETVPLDGKVAEYVAVARRKGGTWYVGAITNWTGRDLEIDCSFLPAGTYEAEVFKDGLNANHDATDYIREVIKIKSGDKLNLKLKNGGGWAARIYPAK
ncbi:MAG: glycoside hydrolase family 97 protein [Mucilaginibacter sp.]